MEKNGERKKIKGKREIGTKKKIKGKQKGRKDRYERRKVERKEEPEIKKG